jgi:tetratricopeptide (TPR) repeat protein
VPVPHFRRRMVEVNGLPVLEQGFIGRRGLQHEVRRRVHAGQRLLVFQGLGGLGKTALASQLLSHVFAPDTADQVILRCAELDHTSDPIAALRAQVEQHGRDHDFRYWDERALDLRERFPETAPGFGEVVRALRRERPNLVVYADNAENLQTGPVIEDPEMLGAWRAGVEPWWQEMERLAEEGVLVLASTRYAWARLDRRSHLGVGPLSPADCLRMIASFPALRQLPPDVQARLGSRVDGHPRTIELLDRLIAHREGQLGADRKVAEAWSEIIEPVLPEHEEWIRADLLLEKLWERLSEKAREHARHLTVLRRPAPAFVIDRMGTARDELIRSGLLTRFRELSSYQGEARWVERWGVVGLLLRFIPAAKDFPDAHAKAAAAYEEWLLSGGRLRVDQAEVIHHLHAIGMGERAWPTVEDLVLWLRDRGNYREAQDILAGCEAAGTRGGQLASALMLLAQVKRQQGNFGSELDLILKRASALTETEERQHAIRLETSQLWLDRGDLRRAADLLQRLLAETERAQRVPESFRATTMHTLADVLSRQGKYAEAESLLRRAVVIQERDLGTQHPNFAAALDGLAGVLRDRGKYQEAEALFRRARTLHERIWGSEHRTVAASLLGVSSALLWQGRLQESEGALREALRIQETVLGRQHPTWHSALHNLCEVLDRQGKHQEAENLLREVLAAEEEASGEKTLPYAASSYALAKVLTQRGCYEQAEPLLRRALATQGELLGGDHPDYGTTLHGLGDLLDRQGKFAQAEQLFRQAVVIDEGAYGEGHAQHAASVHALAGSVLHQGRHREAEDLLTRCLALQERALGASHPTYAATLQLLASVLEEEGRYAEAEDLLRRVVICDRESLGEDHPSYSFALAALARVLNLRGDLAEAERLIHRALAIQQRSLSRMHPAIAASLNTLAGLLDRQGRTAEAEPLLREALAIQEDSLGKENPNLGPTLANLAGVLMDLGKGQEAEALLHRALQISLAIHGFYRCETGQILSFLAQAQRSMGKPEAAESAFRALRSLHGGPGPEHPITQELTPLLQEIAAGR